MLSVCKAQEIREWITRRMDLWKRGIPAGLVVDAKAEEDARESRAARGGEEEDKAIAWSYHIKVLLGKMIPVIHRATNKDRVGCLLPY